MTNQTRNKSDQLVDEGAQYVVTWTYGEVEGYDDIDQAYESIQSVLEDELQNITRHKIELDECEELSEALAVLSQAWDALQEQASEFDVNTSGDSVTVWTIEDYLDDNPPSNVVQTEFDALDYSNNGWECVERHYERVAEFMGIELGDFHDMNEFIASIEDKVSEWPERRTWGKVTMRTEVV